MTFDEHQQAAAEQPCVRVALGFALSAIAVPSAWVSFEMLLDTLDRSLSVDTPSLRALAAVTADALSDRLLGEHALSAAQALAVLHQAQC